MQTLKLNHKVIVIDNFFSIGRKSNLSNIKSKIKIVNQDILNEKIDKYFKGVENVYSFSCHGGYRISIENPKLYFDVNVNIFS